MKRKFILTLAAVLAAALFFGAAAGEIGRETKTAEYREETLWGDPASAAGVTVEFPMNAGYDHFIWENRVRFDGAGKVLGETEYDYCDFLFHRHPERNNLPILDVGMEDITEPLEQLIEEIRGKMGEQIFVTRSVALGDYFEVYPLWIEGWFPNLTQADRNMEYYNLRDAAVNKLQDYFAPSVLENDWWDLTVYSADNASCGISPALDGDSYWPNAVRVTTEDCCYFVLSNKSEDGEILQLGNVPGRYGVYLLPFGKTEKDIPYADADHLKQIYALDEAENARAIGLDIDKEQLWLLTTKGNEVIFRSIRISDGTLLTEIPLKEQCLDYLTAFSRKDTVAVVSGDDGLTTVLCRDGQGQYREVFSCREREGEPEVLSRWMHGAESADFIWDGQRLALAYSTYYTTSENPTPEEIAKDTVLGNATVLTAIYTQDGLEYLGRIHSSASDSDFLLPAGSGYLAYKGGISLGDYQQFRDVIRIRLAQ